MWHIRVKPGYRVKLTIRQSAFGIGIETNKENCLAKDYMVVSSRSQGFSDYRFAERFHFSISFKYRRVGHWRDLSGSGMYQAHTDFNSQNHDLNISNQKSVVANLPESLFSHSTFDYHSN